ncbi:MAG: hypothetical protein QOD07_2533 [Frankiaceae bacterium]|jgi:hypothetical protein|nr:hypothetical protein [Frankiaceae bacterium]
MYPRFIVVGCVAVAALGSLTSCKPAPKSDSNTPRVYMLAWNEGSNGTENGQVTVNDGGSFSVNQNFLGPNKADIRVYGSEDPGVSKVVVTGTGRGTCSSKPDSNLQTWTTPSAVGFTVATQTESAPAGQVEDFLAASMDDALKNISCGMHRYANMPSSQEFFLDEGTVTLNATAYNCCGGQATATFTVDIK